MEDINGQLLSFFRNHPSPELSYSQINDICTFLKELSSSTFNENQNRAIKIMASLVKQHGKEKFIPFLENLANIERDTIPREIGRDHVVHTVLCFLLGIYINDKCTIGIDFFQWKLASVLHDVGYLFNLPMKIYRNHINTLLKELSLPNFFQEKFLIYDLQKLEQLYDKQNSSILIFQQLTKWGIELDKSENEKENGNHGIISALSAMAIIDELYHTHNQEKKNNNSSDIDWNPDFFTNDIVPVCSAIFAHSLKLKYPIQIDKSPLAYLLILSDCLQDWGREGEEQRSSEGYRINNNGSKIIFSVPENKAPKIKNELNQKLDRWDEYIQILTSTY